MHASKKKYFTVTALAVLFLLPGIIAIVIFMHPEWLSGMKTNRGTLLRSPYVLQSLEQDSKWQIYYWNPKNCEATCRESLDILARMRLALGRKLYRVDIVWLQTRESASPDTAFSAQLANLDIHRKVIDEQDAKRLDAMPAGSSVFIADPSNYVILAYPDAKNPKDIYLDIKHLLGVSKEKGDTRARS